MVAKSYKDYPILSEPYEKNKKMYIDIRCKNGSTKSVRWYTQQEYAKLYPEEKVEVMVSNQREVLGFQEGYITIFKGVKPEREDWFKESLCRYCVHWGWYVPSTMEVPSNLPPGVSTQRLDWSTVGTPDGKLKSLKERCSFTIGSTISISVSIDAIEETTDNWGTNKTYKMFDDQYSYSWTTKAERLWAEKDSLNISAQIKDITNNEIILARCKELN